MKKVVLATVLVSSLLFGGCGFLMVAGAFSPPMYEMPANADVGAYPDNYEDLVRTYMSKALKRPKQLIVWSITKPSKNWASDPWQNKQVFGYSSTPMIWLPEGERQEGYGHTMFLFIRDGKVLGNVGGTLPKDEFKEGFWPEGRSVLLHTLCCKVD